MSSGNEFSYMFLNRLLMDVNYFLGYGCRSIRVLYFETIEEHINEMKKIWRSFDPDKKPEWLSFEEIEEFEKEMLS